MIVHVQFFVLSSYVTNNALLDALYNGVLLKGYVYDNFSIYGAIEQLIHKLLIRHAGIEPTTIGSWMTLFDNLAIWLCFNLLLFISVLFANKWCKEICISN